MRKFVFCIKVFFIIICFLFLNTWVPHDICIKSLDRNSQRDVVQINQPVNRHGSIDFSIDISDGKNVIEYKFYKKHRKKSAKQCKSVVLFENKSNFIFTKLW